MPTPPVRRLALAGVAAVSLGLGSTALFAQSSSFSTAEQDEIRELVRAYLVDHPEVITEALTALQAREAAAEAEKQRGQIAALRTEIFEHPGSPVMGNPDGDVTLVEFFDYQCGYCKRMLENMFTLVEEDPNVRVVFKEFPILGPASVVGARAALAARMQGEELYVSFYRTLMGQRGTLTEDLIYRVAESVGLDVDRLKRDMNDPSVEQELAGNVALAQSLGIGGTPAFIIGDEVVPGAMSMEDLEALVARERAS